MLETDGVLETAQTVLHIMGIDMGAGITDTIIPMGASLVGMMEVVSHKY